MALPMKVIPIYIRRRHPRCFQGMPFENWLQRIRVIFLLEQSMKRKRNSNIDRHRFHFTPRRGQPASTSTDVQRNLYARIFALCKQKNVMVKTARTDVLLMHIKNVQNITDENDTDARFRRELPVFTAPIYVYLTPISLLCSLAYIFWWKSPI